MSIRPLLRQFFPCWNGVPGTRVEQHQLAHLVSFVRPKTGDGYPLLLPELCFFAVLADGRGTHEFLVRQLFGVGTVERMVWHSQPGIMNLGNDPIALHGLPLRLKNIEFPEPGQYEFVLLCDGVELGSVFVEARH